MITLGINAAFHDSSAVIVRDGQLIAAAEEERFTRIKHAKRPLPFTAWELPFHAVDFCLAARKGAAPCHLFPRDDAVWPAHESVGHELATPLVRFP